MIGLLLHINTAKTRLMVFVHRKPRSQASVVQVIGGRKDTAFNILGIAIGEKLSLAPASFTYALKTLRPRGISSHAMHEVTKSNRVGETGVRFSCLVGSPF